MTHWRAHPALADKFHPDFPDDLQVLIHDGGPRLSAHHPELVWVRVTGGTGTELTGTVLNQPDQVGGVQERSVITFLVPDGGPAPVMVTKQYLRERPDWIVQPCDGCGFTELLDAPSDLIRKVFPTLPPGATPDAFTSLCALCGGVQLVQNKDAELDDEDDLEGDDVEEDCDGRDPPSPSRAARKWWQLWK